MSVNGRPPPLRIGALVSVVMVFALAADMVRMLVLVIWADPELAAIIGNLLAFYMLTGIVVVEYICCLHVPMDRERFSFESAGRYFYWCAWWPLYIKRASERKADHDDKGEDR